MQNKPFKTEARGGWVRLRRLAIATLALLATTAGAGGSDPGYLPCIGPAPLRFHVVAPASTNVFHLPKPAAAPAPQPEPPAVAQLPTPPPVVSAATNPPPPQPATVTPTNDFPDIAPQGDVVSPQMFLKFFNKGTNGSSGTVAVPLDFTPPKAAPSTPAPSKAEYSTTP